MTNVSGSEAKSEAKPAYKPPLSLYRTALLAIILAAFGLRLFQLGDESLWYDETFSAYLSSQPIPELIAHTARDIHPPGYYLLLHFWRAVAQPMVSFGLEFLLAWPSVAGAMLVVAFTAALAHRLFGKSAALLAVFFAAVHPTEIWFAQEVRMYAPATALFLAALWFAFDLLPQSIQPADNTKDQRHSVRRKPWTSTLTSTSAGAYACLIAAALYLLYYSLFWLIVLNALVLGDFWWRRRSRPGGWRPWLFANLGGILLWTPWIPIFLRQALTPPVAPWREPWTRPGELWVALIEAVAALWIGHTPPGELNWPWAAVIAVVLIVATILAIRTRSRQLGYLLALMLLPPFGLLFISAVASPIYHVRYVAPFATLAPIVLAALLIRLRPRISSALIVIMLVVIQLAALRSFWTSPDYAADDHRTAVADLARAWRPGDAIVVNAGWVYTALATYWPTDLPTPLATRPPQIARWPRLTALAGETTLDFAHPTVIRTGTLDGSPTLGWGLPESDFFAITTPKATDAIDNLTAAADRIWHYRLYDTVNDPTGVIRAALAAAHEPSFQQAYPGPGYLLIERYDSTRTTDTPTTTQPVAQYPSGLKLNDVDIQGETQAGEILYVGTTWIGQINQWTNTGGAPTAGNIGLSLRLIDADGVIFAQSDTTIFQANGTPPEQTATVRQSLGIPGATPPGRYQIVLIAYERETLKPLVPQSQTAPMRQLAAVDIALPRTHPHVPAPQATFDYLALLANAGLPESATAGGDLSLDLIWMARPSPYQDDYAMRITLHPDNMPPVQSWTIPLGTATYPSSAWATGLPVLRRINLPLSSDLPAQDYTLSLQLHRAADSMVIEPDFAWLPWRSDQVDLGRVKILAKE